MEITLWRRMLCPASILPKFPLSVADITQLLAAKAIRVTELVGFEHTMKNELILAERHQLSNAQARGELLSLLKQLPARPALVEGFA